MFRKTLSFLLLLLALSTFFVSTSNSTLIKADKILYNGVIFTSNVNNPMVEALAIKSGYILGVGTTVEMMNFNGIDTQLFDLEGRVAIPGFNDSHIHFLPYDVPGSIRITHPEEFVPGPGPNVAEVMALIQEKNVDPNIPPDAPFFVIVGEGFIDDPAQPSINRLSIDAIAPYRPVFIQGVAGHYLVVNSATLFVAGISDTEANPFGGYYERFEGTPIINGRLQQYAIYDVVKRLRGMIPDEYFQSQMAPLFQQLVEWGVTSIQDIPIGLSSARYENILKTMPVPIRVRNVAFPFSIEESHNIYNTTVINPTDKIISAGIKWITDGTQQESYAALTQEYYDNPGWYGEFSFSNEDFSQMVADGLTGWNLNKQQRQFHCVGDQAIENLLTTMSSSAPDWLWSLRRVTIAHADMIGPDMIADIAAKNIVPLKFPSQFIYPYVWYSRLGAERFSTVQPLKSLVDGGVKISLASDMLGGVWNPFLTLKLAVAHPTNPAEALDLPTAIIAHTLGGAYAEYMELFKGSLQPGRFADLVVLDTNIFDPANFMTIENTRSVLTLVGGNIVYNNL
jgi:hypothetical protein